MNSGYRIAALPLAFLFADVAVAQSEDATFVQGMLGALNASEAWELENQVTGEKAKSDLGTLPYGGAAAQMLYGEGAFQYGFEGGGLVSWKNSNQQFAFTNNSVAVSFDNTLFLLDISMGGVLSWRPANAFRMYVAAGPSFNWGRLQVDNKDKPEPAPSSVNVEIEAGGSSHAVALGLYGRAGLEFIVNDFTFGVSARKLNAKLDFGKNGTIRLNDLAWFLTIGKQI